MNKQDYDIEEAARGFHDLVRDGGKSELPSQEIIRRFRELVLGYYRRFRRDFPWRQNNSLYEIVVSEVMLQQTTTARVAEKFTPFIEAFPTVAALASAERSEVLRLWQGLGYNRRAVMLHRLAATVMEDYGGTIPESPEELVKLPGIGKATAASICAFGCNMPVAFIETNVRSVFIFFFFPGEENVDDRDIMPLVEATLDKTSPREWYSALMDYGVMLKKQKPNPSRRSRHHQRQSAFEGSDRQVRGRILKSLLEEPGLTAGDLTARLDEPGDRVVRILTDLTGEEMITLRNKKYYI